VFHVFQLKKCLCVPEEQIPMEDLDAKKEISYHEYPIKMLETSERVTQNKRIKVCKVQWSHHTEEEATWKREEELRPSFQVSFLIHLNLKVEIHFKGVRVGTPYFSQRNKTLGINYLNK
jgi:hypothetical protein